MRSKTKFNKKRFNSRKRIRSRTVKSRKRINGGSRKRIRGGTVKSRKLKIRKLISRKRGGAGWNIAKRNQPAPPSGAPYSWGSTSEETFLESQTVRRDPSEVISGKEEFVKEAAMLQKKILNDLELAKKKHMKEEIGWLHGGRELRNIVYEQNDGPKLGMSFKFVNGKLIVGNVIEQSVAWNKEVRKGMQIILIDGSNPNNIDIFPKGKKSIGQYIRDPNKKPIIIKLKDRKFEFAKKMHRRKTLGWQVNNYDVSEKRYFIMDYNPDEELGFSFKFDKTKLVVINVNNHTNSEPSAWGDLRPAAGMKIILIDGINPNDTSIFPKGTKSIGEYIKNPINNPIRITIDAHIDENDDEDDDEDDYLELPSNFYKLNIKKPLGLSIHPISNVVLGVISNGNADRAAKVASIDLLGMKIVKVDNLIDITTIEQLKNAIDKPNTPFEILFEYQGDYLPPPPPSGLPPDRV